MFYLMKNIHILLLALFPFFAGVLAFAAADPVSVCAQDKCFQSEVMSTPEGRAQGLMSRESLPDDQGMLFIFEEPGEYPFWMKNMSFPIDIVWLDEDKRVVHAELSVPPCLKDPCPVYAPQSKALYVLEVADGQVEAGGIRHGDQLIWN